MSSGMVLGAASRVPSTPTAQIIDSFKGRIYNPRRDRDEHFEKWLDDVQDLLLQHPKLLKIVLGQIELADMASIVKRLKGEGHPKESAKSSAIMETEEHQRLNTDAYTILRGITDLTGVYKDEDVRTINQGEVLSWRST